MCEDKYNLSFSQKKAIGRVGEEAAKKVFEKIMPTYYVIDVSEEPDFQSQDIDFLLSTGIEGVDILSVEVKTDRQMGKTGNLCLETITNTVGRKKGWYRTSTADIICFYDTLNDELHILNFDELKAAVRTTPAKEVTIKEWEGPFLKSAICLIVSKSCLEKAPSYGKHANVLGTAAVVA